MRAGDGRDGLVLWGTDAERGFSAQRRARFTPRFDGRWHDYDVRFTAASPLRQLRIDGSLKPAELEFEWVRLCREDGTVVRAWDFAQGQ
jgi:hypothetical protein